MDIKSLFVDLVLPIGIKIISEYTKTTSSKNDDLILQAVQKGVGYLSEKNNNNVLAIDSSLLNSRQMEPQFGFQKSWKF